MKIAVIGGGGFTGRKILRLLTARDDVSEVRALDRTGVASTGIVRAIEGDFSNPELRDKAVDGADVVIHLATVLGGAAEADPALARQINVDATLDLIDHLKATAPQTRFVFASTIGVLKTPFPSPATDAAPLGAMLLYGAQKQMIEVALSNYVLRGWLDAVSLRPSGIMARDGADASLKSAFMSRVFYAVKRGEDITLPVAEDSQTWLASVENVAQNFVHAAMLPNLGADRAFTLPALTVTFGELVAALKRRFPTSTARVTFAPDPETISMFGAMPKLTTEIADQLGFARDEDADALVASAIEEE